MLRFSNMYTIPKLSNNKKYQLVSNWVSAKYSGANSQNPIGFRKWNLC